MKSEKRRNISGCGLSGLIHTKGGLVRGDVIVSSIATQHDRGNGLGGGFAAYGIYPEHKDFYALHIMYDDKTSLAETEEYLRTHLFIENRERIPIRKMKAIPKHPIFRRYFVKPQRTSDNAEMFFLEGETDDDYLVRIVMEINTLIKGAYVFSSGKNMGAFKGVGFPEEIAEFFRIDEYKGYIWTAHNRFPTNTPGWWGGAHPFTLLDWSIVHNGEISSYGINKRYLEMFGYRCELLTDTEVVAYMLDLLVRKHGLSKKLACMVLASPFWKDVDLRNDEERNAVTVMRMVYGSGLLNGPFAILFAHSSGLIGLNDRIKLRPLVVAVEGDLVYMASEESAIREIAKNPERVWTPRAGEPVIVELEKEVGVVR